MGHGVELLAKFFEAKRREVTLSAKTWRYVPKGKAITVANA
jgi:hypothetical protein